MRVLLLSQFYPPTLGGVETHVAALASGLAARGHDVAVATFGDGPAEDGDVHVFRVGGLAQRIGALHATERRHAPPLPDPVTVRELRRVVAEFRPDIVHAHNWLGRSFVPLARHSAARFIVTLHDCGRACAQGRAMYRGRTACAGPRPLRCLGCATDYYGTVKGLLTLGGNAAMRGPESRAASLYLPVSSAVADMNGLATDGVPYEVVPNFAEEPRAADAAALPAGLPSEPYILQVGDIVADKGVDVLLDAYRRLDAPPPLVLVGRTDGSVDAAGTPGVSLAGSLPHDLVAPAWRGSIFGTMPSLCLDASPTVTLEAMAAARPVVASAIGGLTDQVAHGVTGLLVPPGDPAALAVAMSRLIDDAALRARMGAAARTRYEQHFSAEVVIDRIESLYGRLLSSSR